VLEIQIGSSPAAKIAESGNEQIATPLPKKFALSPNHPNPFNAQTVIEYALPQAGKVRLVIYNTLGQVVRKLIDEPQEAGYKRILWDGTNEHGARVSSGLYFYQVQFGSQRLTGKMILQQ